MNRLLSFLRRNGLMVLLAFLLSWMIWVQVSTVFLETTEITIPVRITADDPDPDRILLLGHEPQKLRLVVRATRRTLDRIDWTTFTPGFRIRSEFLDRSGGLQTRVFTEEDLRLPEDLELKGMEPPRITARFAEKGADTVEVRVDTDVSGLPTHLKLLDTTAVPARVHVEGPRKLITGLLDEEGGKISTVKIKVEEAMPEGTETEVTRVVPLALEGLEETGLSADIPEVTVLFRFAHVHREENVRIPLEVHWVDPHPDGNATCFQITPGQGAVEEHENRLKIKVTLIGPRDTLKDKTQIEQIKAYVRSDEALKKITQGLPAPVHFAFLPEGVQVERIQEADLPTVTPENTFRLKRDE